MKLQITIRDWLWLSLAFGLLLTIYLRTPRETNNWQRGPMPSRTYGWGGVVPSDLTNTEGFYFADFCGDHVVLNDGRVVQASEVRMFNNDLTLPLRDKHGRLMGAK